MFVDHVNLYVKGGDGGDGMVAFRREKYVPDGGPAGGDGGRGADVVFEVDEGLRTLMDFRYQRHFKAKRGDNGRSKNQHGRGGEDLIVRVPPGTIIRDRSSDVMIADLTEHKQRVVVAKGGRGGRGNTRFASPSNPAPEISEKGEPAEEKDIQLELKVLADVGLVGFPSVGKSTLLSIVSAARPKIADYPFTTLKPNLGVVDAGEGKSFVMADLPGLIAGAHEGVGLGAQFLRHIERTRVLVHIVDMAGELEGRDPFEDFQQINSELREHNLRLLERPMVVMANKMDMPGTEEQLEEFKKKLPEGIEVFPVSTLRKQGIQPLLQRVADLVETTPAFHLYDEEDQEEKVVYTLDEKEAPFYIGRADDGAYVLYGPDIEKHYRMADLSHEDSMQRFSRKMRNMGVDEALRERGAKHGDTVRLLDFEFEFVDG
ncbi:GTPase ObgE [Marinococcus luteus]|uniref:GTPase ObgE n=1 Tax=Marinococcus luteus TaxID=1122204 RepID=UPI002ACD04C8|nr:GTPase ObgE [Marinococcus luteus]MDZ5782870.1 GTPase ObgE [Marinococcus luteus]